MLVMPGAVVVLQRERDRRGSWQMQGHPLVALGEVAGGVSEMELGLFVRKV